MALRAALAALALATATGAEAEQSFSGDYTVSFLGLTIARSTFSTRLEGPDFRVNGSVNAAGLAVLFDDTSGTVSTTGRFARRMPQADDFRVDYTEGGKSRMILIGFRNGTVTRTVNVPPLKKRGSDWVPIEKAHLVGVTDPLSAVLVAADSPDRVCHRTVRIYDGEMRADLTLTPHSSGTISVPGYEGPTVVCRLHFTPVAGYRKGRRALEFLKNRAQMHISFAQIGTTGVYAPVHATIGTQIGTLTVSARGFGVAN